MESDPDKMDKNDESGEPSDSVENVGTDTIENIVEPECHPVEVLKNNANSSNSEINEDIDLNDIVLITESLPPVVESLEENNKSIEPNITDKECDVQQAADQNECENVNIDNIQLIEATDNEIPNAEKCDDEPMDIDEILNSLGDFDTPSSSEAPNVCEAPPFIDAEKPSEPSSSNEKEGKQEDIVSLIDDDDDDEEVGKGRFYLHK